MVCLINVLEDREVGVKVEKPRKVSWENIKKNNNRSKLGDVEEEEEEGRGDSECECGWKRKRISDKIRGASISAFGFPFDFAFDLDFDRLDLSPCSSSFSFSPSLSLSFPFSSLRLIKSLGSVIIDNRSRYFEKNGLAIGVKKTNKNICVFLRNCCNRLLVQVVSPVSTSLHSFASRISAIS